MTKLFSFAIAAVLLSGSGAVAAELPTYAVDGFPITPHQLVAVNSARVQEQSPTPTFTLAGMPASPHQIAVLTPRSKTEIASTSGLTNVRFTSPSGQ
jgi:hypothetical protein